MANFKEKADKLAINGVLDIEEMTMTCSEDGQVANILEDFKKEFASYNGKEIKLTINLAKKE